MEDDRRAVRDRETLVAREIEDFDLSLGSLAYARAELAEALPAARAPPRRCERQRKRVQARHTPSAAHQVERRLADAKLEVGRLESDLALAAERLGNAGQRRQTAADERVQAERRAAQAEREHEAAAAERTAAERDLAAVQSSWARGPEKRTTCAAVSRPNDSPCVSSRKRCNAAPKWRVRSKSKVGRWTASAASCASSWRSHRRAARL